MNKKRLLIVVRFLVIFLMIMCVSYRTAFFAQECQLISISDKGSHGSVRIEPENLLISRGDCVIWFNRAVIAGEVKVIFDDAKKCSSETEAPVGFSFDNENYYDTNWIPFAGTSSLRFTMKGKYTYVIEAKDRESVKTKGEIQVN